MKRVLLLGLVAATLLAVAAPASLARPKKPKPSHPHVICFYSIDGPPVCSWVQPGRPGGRDFYYQVPPPELPPFHY